MNPQERERLKRYFMELGASEEEAERRLDELEAEDRYWELVDLREKLRVDWLNAPDSHPCEDWGCEEAEEE